MLSKEERKAVIDLFPFMGERPVVFDCGANKGSWADIILDEFGDNCELHLFEPNDKLLSFTQIKYEYRPNIYYHNVALSNEQKERYFYYFENFNNELSSLYENGEEWDKLPEKKKKVNTSTLNLFYETLGIKYIDYIKIDCEGADLEILQGASALLESNNAGVIQIEYSEHWQRGNHTWGELKSIAGKYGYKIYRYIDDNFWEVKEEDPPFDNYFITKFEIHNYCISGSNDNFILNTLELPKMDLILEIGAMEGITTKYMCEKLLNTDNPNARVIVVDPLFDYYVKDDPRYHPEFKHQYQRFKRNTRGLPVDLKRGKSQDELPLLNALRADMVYIDGDHYPDTPYFDGCWAFALTKIGGHILFDDFLWCDETKASIQKFLDEFIEHYELVAMNYQVLIRKTSDFYNPITQSYYL